MSAIIDYVSNLDATQLVIHAGVAVVALLGVKKLISSDQGHQKLLEQQKKIQSVEIGSAKPGEGAVHRRKGYEGQLTTTFDPQITTTFELFNAAVKKNGNNPCLGTRKVLGEEKWGDYEWETYSEIQKRRDNFGSGIAHLYNHQPGEFVGIYSINRTEWVVTDLACSAYSWASIALYDTLGQNAVEFIIKHANIKVVVCAKKQLKTILSAVSNCNSLKTVICMDPITPEEAAQAKKFNITLTTFEAVEKVGAENPKPVVPPKSSDFYTIMYTSGTTGDPKGVILTHANLIAEISGVYNHDPNIVTVNDVHISYLPFAHSFERAAGYMILATGAKIGFYSGNIANLFNDIATLRPTFLVGAPRVWSRLYDKLTLTINSSGFVKKTMFNYGFAAKKAALLKGQTAPLWDSLVFSKTKARLGGRVRFIFSGSAPLDPKLGEFIKICFCCPVLEGYGLTENFAGASITLMDETQFGHVGTPLSCTEVKLVDVPEMDYSSKNTPPTGEIMLRGPNVFQGYYKDAEKTKEAIEDDGWFHTGDIGRWNPNGTLSIIDRKKNIFKLSQGEYVAVEYLENVYIRSGFVGQIWVYGSSFKRFLVGVVVLDPEFVAKWASDNGLPTDVKTLVTNDKLKKAVMQDLERVGKEAKLQGFEFVKEVVITTDSFTTDNDLMTPTFKLRRAQLLKHYKKEVDEMYAKIGE